MRPALQSISDRIALAMLADQRRLRAQLRAIQRRARARQPIDRSLDKLAQDIDRSASRRARRLDALPRPVFPEELPVVQRKDDIARAITENQVIVLCGETGSGKTTQLPKICLELGRGVTGMIGHTQPRRIAARSVAARIASELGTPIGHAVGYKVRFGDKTSAGGAETFIKVMTDGILLAETQGDPLLEQYDTIIIDEAHERSLNIDFLLGYLKRLLPKRPDLKVIVTSATINPARFARHFAEPIPDAEPRPAPVVEVSGRMYPVEVRYRPPSPESLDPGADAADFDLESAVLAAVDELGRLPPGDILIFLSGEREIREVAEALRKHHPPGVEILPLYARLSAAEQQKVFEPHRGRRIVLATNVAETSLTVPGIRYVVDPGTARILRYSSRTKVQRLPIEPISRASADQRKGRCGRVAAGVCIRLYSEEDYLARPLYTEPEILRTNLASVILQMKALNMGEVVDFPFVEPPESRFIRDGYDTLLELGAVDERGQLTQTGKDLARFPIDPRVGRMILGGQTENALAEVLIIASALSIQDPRERPLDRQEAADEAHKRFAHEDSDFLSLINLWKFYQEQSRHLSHSKLRRACQQNFLSPTRMREWDDVYRQLHGLVADMGYHTNTTPAEYEPVHRALLTGLLSNVGSKAPDGFEYQGARSTRFSIFPGSALFKKNPKWTVAAEIVQTMRLYARTVAKVQPQWIEQVGSHVIKRTYTEPHWNPEKARVEAYERVTIFGLELVAKRPVHYGPIDPKVSRELFIHHALVEGEFNTRARFFEHNQQLRKEVEALEARSRERNLLAEAEKRFEFYDKRVPAGVYSAELFESWRKDAERKAPGLLLMTIQDLLQEGSDAAFVTRERFPTIFSFGAGSGTIRLPLTYRLEPGHPEDGVTLTIPIEVMNQVPIVRTQWLVPGMVKEKITALIKLLPKALRTNFIPAPEFADRTLEVLFPPPGEESPSIGVEAGETPFLEALALALEHLRDVPVPSDAWQDAILPEHLRMHFAVVDRAGKRLASGRDLDLIRRQLRAQLGAALARVPDARYNRESVAEWDFGDLPERIEVKHEGLTITAHPALAAPASPSLPGKHDPGALRKASIRLFESLDAANASMPRGLRILFLNQVRHELAFLLKNLPGLDRLSMQYATLGTAAEFKEDLSYLIVDRAFELSESSAPIRTEAQFRARLDPGWSRLSEVAHDAAALAASVLAEYQPVSARLAGPIPQAWSEAVGDIASQLSRLVHRFFLSSTPYVALQHYPRYLRAIMSRLNKLQNAGPARDQKHSSRVAPLWGAYIELESSHRTAGIQDPELDRLRWMIEELRVSLFAQELGTPQTVSVKRVEEQLARVRSR